MQDREQTLEGVKISYKRCEFCTKVHVPMREYRKIEAARKPSQGAMF